MKIGQTEMAASFAYTENGGGVAMVGFADHQYDTKEYVILQRTLRPTSDDIRRGWDNVHIMVNDESRSAYGGVKQITLHDITHVLIEVESATANYLRIGATIDINIANALVDRGQLAEILKLVCGEYVQFTQRL